MEGWCECLSSEFILEPLNDSLTLRQGVSLSFFITRFGLVHRAEYRVEELEPLSRIRLRQVQGLFDSFEIKASFLEGDLGAKLNLCIEASVPYGLFGALIEDLWLKSAAERWLLLRQKSLEEKFILQSDVKI